MNFRLTINRLWEQSQEEPDGASASPSACADFVSLAFIAFTSVFLDIFISVRVAALGMVFEAGNCESSCLRLDCYENIH